MSRSTGRPVAVRFHDRGEVWSEQARLGDVLYQLRVILSDADQEAVSADPPVTGTLLPDGPGWNAIQNQVAEPLWLHLRDGRRLPFSVTNDAGSILHIHALSDFVAHAAAA